MSHVPSPGPPDDQASSIERVLKHSGIRYKFRTGEDPKQAAYFAICKRARAIYGRQETVMKFFDDQRFYQMLKGLCTSINQVKLSPVDIDEVIKSSRTMLKDAAKKLGAQCKAEMDYLKTIPRHDRRAEMKSAVEKSTQEVCSMAAARKMLDKLVDDMEILMSSA